MTETIEVGALPQSRFVRFLPQECSELNLEYEFEPASAIGGSPTLAVRYLPGIRAYLPYGGEVRLRLEFDGELVRTSIVTFAWDHPDICPLPQSALRAGKHSIRMSLEQGSTTTCRLYDVEVVVRRR